MNDITTRERIEHCNAVARFESHRGHGHFLTAFLDAWFIADNENVLILLPAFEQLIAKYHLKEHPQK